MLLLLKTAGIQSEYVPFTDNSAEVFYHNALTNSKLYRRASGYFSSAVLNLFAIEFLDFAQRGGKIEIVCSNELSSDDVEVLHNAEQDFDQGILQQISDLDADDISREQLQFFGTLLKHRVLELKIAQYHKGRGIFHDKTGAFHDANGDIVTFRGSANETFMGWSEEGNFETLEAFCSWQTSDETRVQNHVDYLERVWSNTQSGLLVKPISEVTRDELIIRSREDLDDFRSTLEKRKAKENISAYGSKARRPLFGFQKEVLKNWAANNHRGIIKHATGSGKTVTAIEAIRRHVSEGNAAIVLVPSVLLLRQWAEELQSELSEVVMQVCGDGHTAWKRRGRLRSMLNPVIEGQGSIILATLDTASSSEFLSKLINAETLLCVVDEAHNLGSPNKQKIMEVDFQKRLGLSATPERHLDPEGTTKIFNFFDGVLEPEISIFDAIKLRRLVNYQYYPKPAHLDSEELAQYNAYTKKIIRSLGSKSANEALSEATKTLLIQRSRIVKKAKVKLLLAVDIVSKSYRDGQYWLLYCDDTDQLNELNDRLRYEGINPRIYTTTMEGSKEAELADYVKRGGVMLSIGCLDEGVDIPKISHAVILASSQNPRQFIQRRGRVLRMDGVKDKAVIYDLFTLPPLDSDNFPANILKVELKRADEFAQFALNKYSAMLDIKERFIEMGLDLGQYFNNEGDIMIDEGEIDK